MDEALALIEKHRGNGLLLDSNLCVLYLVGRTNEHRISRFDRTASYTVRDFHFLDSTVTKFRTVVTTPHVLTEVSNLARLGRPELGRLRGLLRELAERLAEIYHESRLVAADPRFPDLGPTDAINFNPIRFYA